MELKKGPVSVVYLFVHSFGVAARSMGSIFILAILLVLATALIGFLLFKLGLTSPAQLMAASLVVGLISTYLSAVFQAGILNIIEGKIEHNGRTIPESLYRSLVPGFFMIITGVLIAIVPYLIMFVLGLSGSLMRLSPGSILTIALPAYILILLALLPLVFVQPALALRQTNPISCIVYSYQLIRGNYLRTLFALICMVFIPLAFLFFSAAAVSTYLIPFLTQHGLMDITASITQFGGAGLVAAGLYLLLFCYVLLTMTTALTALFLNLDYQKNRNIAIFADDSPLPTPGGQPSFVADDILADEQVQVLQSSVKSVTNHNELEKQFNDVYASLEKTQTQQDTDTMEEDRMPTILFDEDMARQIAESQQTGKQKMEPAPGPTTEDTNSIKISKR